MHTRPYTNARAPSRLRSRACPHAHSHCHSLSLPFTPPPSEGWTVPEGQDNGLGIGLDGEDGGGFLEVIWGDDADEFNPITQIRQASVELSLERGDQVVQQVKQTLPQREYTAQELVAYAAASGVFEEPRFYGALEPEFVDVADEEAAFRLVAVLTKRAR